MSQKFDLMELFGKNPRQDERQFHKQIINVHEFYLSGLIDEPEEYIQWFDTIRHAGENDVVKIYLNSDGGSAFTAIQFMRVFQESSASIVVSVEGMCASAATMIMLSADSFEISDHSVFMFHNYSAGVFGKGGEMFDQLKHMRGWSEKLLRTVYNHFLTESEIISLLDNKDIWMDSEEVVKRLVDRQEKLDSEEKAKDEPTETLDIEELKKVVKKKTLKHPVEKI